MGNKIENGKGNRITYKMGNLIRNCKEIGWNIKPYRNCNGNWNGGGNRKCFENRMRKENAKFMLHEEKNGFNNYIKIPT